jgi:hypothetical protein
MLEETHSAEGEENGEGMAEPGHRRLIALGVVLLVALMLLASFSVGAYVAERGVLLPPLPTPTPLPSPTDVSTPEAGGLILRSRV